MDTVVAVLRCSCWSVVSRSVKLPPLSARRCSRTRISRRLRQTGVINSETSWRSGPGCASMAPAPWTAAACCRFAEAAACCPWRGAARAPICSTPHAARCAPRKSCGQPQQSRALRHSSAARPRSATIHALTFDHTLRRSRARGHSPAARPGTRGSFAPTNVLPSALRPTALHAPKGLPGESFCPRFPSSFSTPSPTVRSIFSSSGLH